MMKKCYTFNSSKVLYKKFYIYNSTIKFLLIIIEIGSYTKFASVCITNGDYLPDIASIDNNSVLASSFFMYCWIGISKLTHESCQIREDFHINKYISIKRSVIL